MRLVSQEASAKERKVKNSENEAHVVATELGGSLPSRTIERVNQLGRRRLVGTEANHNIFGNKIARHR